MTDDTDPRDTPSSGSEDDPKLRQLNRLLLVGVVLQLLLTDWLTTSPLGWFLPSMLLALLAYRALRTSGSRLPEILHGRWLSFGGGYYGIVALGTFLFLEIDWIRSEWQRTGHLATFLQDLSLDWWLGLGIDSFFNGLRATIWPLLWFKRQPLLALVLVVGWIVAKWLSDAYDASEPTTRQDRPA